MKIEKLVPFQAEIKRERNRQPAPYKQISNYIFCRNYNFADMVISGKLVYEVGGVTRVPILD